MDSNAYITDEALRGGLQRTLLARIRRNSRYSLRTFAQALDVDPSLLSKVMRSKRPIGKKFREKVLQRLDAEDLGLNDRQTFQTVKTESFHKICEWYHYAIMELCRLKEFSDDPRWIAGRLRITQSEAAFGWQALVDEGLVERAGTGRWRPSNINPTTVGQTPTSAELRRMQKDILLKAIDALEAFDPSVRDQSTMTMAISSDLIPVAKERIKQFRRDMCALMQECRDCDAVYNLTIGLYPLTKLTKDKNK